MKTTYQYDHYDRYEELTGKLQYFAGQYPDYCKLSSIGKTSEGREIWLLSITKLSAGDFSEKPAFGVNANIHAGEVTGTMCTLYLIDTLLTNCKEQDIDWLLTNYTVYCIPRISPDGAEYYLTTPYSLRSVNKYYPFEKDLPGLTPEDMDGDGVIRQMRVKNPDGAFVISEKDPRVMRKRRPDEESGDFYDVYSEGDITCYEGGEIKSAPQRFGNDFNRNFPVNWLPENKQKGAGSYALSNPETRALADAMAAEKNLCAVLNFHTSGGMYLYPPGFKSAKEADQTDLARWKAIGAMAEEETGYPALNLLDDYVGAAAGTMGIVGAFDDFVSYALGIVDFTCECWDLKNRAGHPSVWPRPEHIPEEEEEQTVTDCIKWLDDHCDGEGYKSWQEFDHPQLGPVEIGGFDLKYTTQNPPKAFLHEEVEKHTNFMLRYMKTLPRLSFENTTVEKMADRTWKIETTVTNRGYLPTCAMKEAVLLKTAKPLKAVFSGAVLAAGSKEEEIGQLEGFSGGLVMYGPQGAENGTHAPMSRRLSYVAIADEGTKVTVAVSAPRAGCVSQTIVLRSD